MKRNKKAMTILTGVIASLVACGVIALFVGYYMLPGLNKNFEKSACKTSIMKADATTEFTHGLMDTEVNCKMQKIVIDKSYIRSDDKVDKDKLFGTIAKSMYECAKLTGRFTLNPFSKWEGKEKQMCLICNEVSFDKEFVEAQAQGKQEIREAELQVWLAKHNAPDQAISFYKYVYGRDPTPDEYKFWDKEITKTDSMSDHVSLIATNTDYLIFWSIDYDGRSWSSLGIVAGVGGAMIGVALAPFTAGVSLTLTGSIFAGVAGGVAAGTAYTLSDDTSVENMVAFMPTDYAFTKMKIGDEDKQICKIVLN